MSVALARIPSTSRANVALWAVQLLLAAMFGMAGVMKTTMPIADLAAQLVWPGEIPPALVRFIGASELLGAVGLVLPSVLRILPRLTPAAAFGLLAIMVLAIPFHLLMGHDPAGIAFDALDVRAGRDDHVTERRPEPAGPTSTGRRQPKLGTDRSGHT